ncbi:WGxxGxxG family protein [Nocardia callitridis]|uniref:WGxxGxxG-CTERM domain-containing protein n=1 Tax=Nocardia callitridis TaxID=648753 RepID=A0ABP9K8M4_9NOCA
MKKLLAVPLTALALTFGGVATAQADVTQPTPAYAQTSQTTTTIAANDNDDNGSDKTGLWGLLGLLGLLGLIPIKRKPSGPDTTNYGNVGRTTRP